MPISDAPDDEKPRLVIRPSGRFDHRLVTPKRLRLDEVDPMLEFVGGALIRIKLEFHNFVLV